MAWLKSFFGEAPSIKRGDGPLSLDIINYVASLVADPSQIDPILDPMREITASMQPGQKLRPQDEATLAKAYLQLEHYLTTAEPLLKLTKESLRQKVVATFESSLSSSESFWSKLP